jgi:cell division septum initiation protein DivIVA
MADEPAEFGPGSFHTPEFVQNGSVPDSDHLVRETEGRAMGAESKAAELEGQLASMRERSARMDEQVEQLRVQLETLADAGFISASSAFAPDEPQDPADEQAMFGAHTPVWDEPDTVEEAEPMWEEPEAPLVWEPPSTTEAPAVPAEPEFTAEAPQPSPEQAEPASGIGPGPTSEEGASDLTAAFASEEIVGVLRAAEEAARRMVERAKATADEQLADVTRRRQELDADAARISAWRQQVGSVVRSMAAEIDEFRAGLEEIPQLLSEAFAPLAQRIPIMQKDIAALAGALGAPVAPTQASPEDRQQIAG